MYYIHHHHHHLSSLCYLLSLDEIICLPWLLLLLLLLLYREVLCIFSLYAAHCTWYTASEEELLNDPSTGWVSRDAVKSNEGKNEKTATSTKFTSLKLAKERREKKKKKRNCFDLSSFSVSVLLRVREICCLYGDRITCFMYLSFIDRMVPCRYPHSLRTSFVVL